VSRIITRLLPLLLFVVFQLFHPGNAGAQQPDRSPSLNLGDAVVTGFSGTLAPDTAKPLPANTSAIDLTFINPDGPSARVIDIRQPGYVWDGRLLAAPKIFDVLAKDVGQVFGIALDDQTPPNIYVAATSAFGLNIVSRGGDGSPERRKKGGPGVGWMKGQFGLDLQGGPGAIYKVDGGSGAVTLFANVTLDGVPNPGTGLGNLAYDSAHKQLFVSDLYTGMIHRFDLNGNEQGRYDHGVTGLGAAKLATVPFDPKNRPNIASARFDSEKPDSWGFAPAGRRVWGLAVHEDRLYYSVVAGPQIWSVGIAGDGSFAADPRWELDVPAQAGALPVSDIAFSHQGAMILAQRGLIAGAYDYSAFTQPGEPQVLRFWLKDPNDPPSPGRWKPVPEEYAVGFAGDDRNTNGGVALGYGYGQDGTLSTTVCEAALWTTGQNLRNNPALRSQLEPGGPLVVHGLQGSPADLVRNANTPPAISYFVDYDDKFDDPRATGHIGSVRVYTTPCAPAAYVRPVVAAAAPGGGGGGGCVGPDCHNACTPTCVCPPGTVLEGRECVKRDCPNGQIFNPATGTCMCPPGTILEGRECVPIQKRQISCRLPLVLDPITDTCVPRRRECTPPLILGPADTCICPSGTVMQDGKCVPQICPPPLVPGPCTCPAGTVQDGGSCVPVTQQGSLIVDKTLTDNTPVPLPPGTLFPMTVTCGPTPFTATFNLTAPGSNTVNNIPVGDTCTVAETLPALPPNLCPQGTVAVWDPPPTYTPPSVVISGTTATITVHNSLRCEDKNLVPLSVAKGFSSDPLGIASTLSFQITLTCTNPLTGTHLVTVHGNSNSVPITLPLGSICTISETGQPALPPGCTWQAPVLPATVTIHTGMNIVTVTNAYTCRAVPPKCPLPQVLNPDGSCGCPTPMVPGPVAGTCICPSGTELVGGKCVTPCPQPQVPNADGVCTCPKGTIQHGKECVRPIDCRGPLVPNAAGTDCVCKSGLVLRGGKCVEPVVCRDPATLNSAGTGCNCPRGMISKGNTCVEPEHNPRIDNPTGIPGFHGRGDGGNPFGGHGGGPGGGGQGGGPGGGGQGGGGRGTFGR
jgi:hypothetical protein